MVSHVPPATPSYTNVISLPEGQEWGGVGVMGGVAGEGVGGQNVLVSGQTHFQSSFGFV